MPITIPTAILGIWKFVSQISAIAFTWVAHPIPNEANAAKTAKSMPSHFIFRPRSSAYIAPPCIRPSLVLTLYFTAIKASAYFVAIPNTPVSQHHRTAPGPPIAIAVPTPTILPVPIVAARAVVNAPNCDTSPSASGSFATDSLIPFKIVNLWMNPVRKVKNTCVPNSRYIIGHPHTTSFTACTAELIKSYILFPFSHLSTFFFCICSFLQISKYSDILENIEKLQEFPSLEFHMHIHYIL